MAQEEIILDVSTGEIIVRAYTAEQIAETQKAVLELDAQKIQTAKKAAEKAALLEKLGITADEAALLLS